MDKEEQDLMIGGTPDDEAISYQKLTRQMSDSRLVALKVHDIERVGLKQANRWDERVKHWNDAMDLLHKVLSEIRKLESE